MTIFASCKDGCDFEVECLTDEQKQRVEAGHRVRHHGEATPLTQLAHVAGWSEALDAARTLAATGRTFLLSDIPDVPHHKTNKGRLASEIHRLGIAHPCDYAPSQRLATRGSAVKLWHADREKCMDAHCAMAEVAR